MVTDLNHIRILIVDDDNIHLLLTKRLFCILAKKRNIDFDIFVDVANSVDNALGFIFSNDLYDLIISDVEMPHKNGFCFFDELKKINYPAKIIANSGNPDYRSICMDYGFMNFQDKSIGTANLFDMVCNLVLV